MGNNVDHKRKLRKLYMKFVDKIKTNVIVIPHDSLEMS